jgi:hypothetical protein
MTRFGQGCLDWVLGEQASRGEEREGLCEVRIEKRDVTDRLAGCEILGGGVLVD